MADGFTLDADVRERTGKGAARALRRTGHIPAVIYGDNQAPIAIAVPEKEMTLALHSGGFLTNVWQITAGGKSLQALARDYQRHPVTDRLVHIDFLRVSASSRVTVDVPLSFIDEDKAPGLGSGGVLSVAEFTVSVEAPATKIPDSLDVSVAGKEVGDTLTSADIKVPDGVTLMSQSDEPFPIASITAPVAEVTEADAPEAADTEVIGEESET
ncbi:MAG: 50S ribosomal protein L25/general stress protein Ctc [Pseudomonadota bacterium]